MFKGQLYRCSCHSPSPLDPQLNSPAFLVRKRNTTAPLFSQCSCLQHFPSITGNFFSTRQSTSWVLREVLSLRDKNQLASEQSQQSRLPPPLAPGQAELPATFLLPRTSLFPWEPTHFKGEGRRLEGRRESESWINLTLLAVILSCWQPNRQVPDSTQRCPPARRDGALWSKLHFNFLVGKTLGLRWKLRKERTEWIQACGPHCMGASSSDPLSVLLLGHEHNYPRCASNHGICSD